MKLLADSMISMKATRDGFKGGPCGPGPRAPTFWGPPQNQYWLGFIEGNQ